MKPVTNSTNRGHRLYCASCGRSDKGRTDTVKTVSYLGHKWCCKCAHLIHVSEGKTCVEQPSPGRMVEGQVDDPLIAWQDCFQQKPKRRIRVEDAKLEIQSAWGKWHGDKNSSQSMFKFCGWLSRFRPYFLTFRCKGGKWQRVHCWLIQRGER